MSSYGMIIEEEDGPETALLMPNEQEEDEGGDEEVIKILHSLHPQHPLTFYEDDYEPNCKLCRGGCFGYYICQQCDFVLHKRCAELPAEFPCPSHPSQPLKRDGEYQEFECGSCCSVSSGFPYRCEPCGFDLDFRCAFFRPVTWRSCEMGRYDGIECSLCGKSCTGTVVGKPSYDGFIHTSCDALPKQIQHPAHPIHPLQLESVTREFKCDGCLLNQHNRKAFVCTDSDCTYCLDFGCAFRFKNSQLIHLDIHPHLLTLTEKEWEHGLCCIICHETCSGPTYSCTICNFDFHMLCVESEEIQNHPSHPSHSLKRTAERREFKCHACLEDRNSKPYRCEDCNFSLDFDCAFVVPCRQELEGTESDTVNNTGGSKREGVEVDWSTRIESCYFPNHLCEINNCGVCDIYVDKLCAAANIPKEIQPQDPLFQGHSLKIFLGEFECSICLKCRSGVHYGCSDSGCKVKLHVTCASGIADCRSIIMLDGHSHPLVLLEIPDGVDVLCHACSNCIEPSSNMFHCPTCDLNLHLLCGPLPCSLKQETHPDMLILKESHVVERKTGDEFYCDSCEEQRDPRGCVYYCGRCYYAAELKCVMPELILALTGKSGDVELRTLGRWPLSGKVARGGLSTEENVQKRKVGGANTATFTLGHIMESLTEVEKKQLDSIFDCGEKIWPKERKRLFEDFGEDASITITTHPVAFALGFVELVERLDSEELTPLKKNWDVGMSFVQVPYGDNLVPKKFLHVYTDLYHKYGDLSAGSGLAPRMKAVFFLLLCETMVSMWKVTVLDVTYKELSIWWVSLKVVRRAGFDIQFATEALKVALRAYFGAKAIDSDNDFAEQIKSHEEKILAMKSSQGQMESELKQYKEYLKSGNSSTTKKCMWEAVPTGYKKVSEVVFSVE